MKNNKITLGVSTRGNLVEMLSKDFNIVDYNIQYVNGKVIKNFDLALVFDDKEFETICKDLNIPYLGTARFGKSEQITTAHQMNINCPETYFFKSKHHFNSPQGRICDTIFSMIDFGQDEEFILKADNGAKGIGQILLTPDELYRFNDTVCGGSNIVPEDGFKLGTDNSDHPGFLETAYNTGEFHIQKMVNVHREFRVNYFYNAHPIIIERTVAKDVDRESWQSNTSVTGEGKVLKYDSSALCVHLNNIAKRLAERLKTPWLSVDIWEDESGNLGIFEFQMQLGYNKVPKVELVRSVNKAVKDYIDSEFVMFKSSSEDDTYRYHNNINEVYKPEPKPSFRPQKIKKLKTKI